MTRHCFARLLHNTLRTRCFRVFHLFILIYSRPLSVLATPPTTYFTAYLLHHPAPRSFSPLPKRTSILILLQKIPTTAGDLLSVHCTCTKYGVSPSPSTDPDLHLVKFLSRVLPLSRWLGSWVAGAGSSHSRRLCSAPGRWEAIRLGPYHQDSRCCRLSEEGKGRPLVVTVPGNARKRDCLYQREMDTTWNGRDWKNTLQEAMDGWTDGRTQQMVEKSGNTPGRQRPGWSCTHTMPPLLSHFLTHHSAQLSSMVHLVLGALLQLGVLDYFAGFPSLLLLGNGMGKKSNGDKRKGFIAPGRMDERLP